MSAKECQMNINPDGSGPSVLALKVDFDVHYARLICGPVVAKKYILQIYFFEVKKTIFVGYGTCLFIGSYFGVFRHVDGLKSC